MFEGRLGSIIGKKFEQFEDGLMAKANRELLRAGSFNETANHTLDQLNVKPEYLQQTNPEFVNMREKLNHSPGLIIANHPLGMEIPVILSTIKRPDLKILVRGKNYDTLAKNFGPEHFICAEKNHVSKVNFMLGEIRHHIGEGGAVLIFPTGGFENRLGRLDFKSGFRRTLEKMDPKNMVYSFYINTTDNAAAMDKLGLKSRIAGLTSEFIWPGLIELNHLVDTAKVRVDENCSTAGDWRELIDKIPNSQDKNRILTEHYKNLFDIQ